jgi:hypothetical protein
MKGLCKMKFSMVVGNGKISAQKYDWKGNSYVNVCVDHCKNTKVNPDFSSTTAESAVMMTTNQAYKLYTQLSRVFENGNPSWR